MFLRNEARRVILGVAFPELSSKIFKFFFLSLKRNFSLNCFFVKKNFNISSDKKKFQEIPLKKAFLFPSQSASFISQTFPFLLWRKF